MASIFSKIGSKEIPADLVYEDEVCFAFKDIEPKAPTHLLIVPREEFASVNEVDEGREKLVGHLVRVAAQLAKARGLGQSGYRLVFNTGSNAGQTVFHLHLHLLGGRPLHEMG
jgi:histidine triad (HIT) family protein